jgi:hypothetical protein
MRYKLLKLIEPKENSIPIWNTFDSIWEFVHLDNWLQLSVELLVEQGFIEEVKEIPKPRWKCGDYVVNIMNSDRKRYRRISEVEEIYKWQFWYDWMKEEYLRDPTKEELKIYFR